ncbi:hypothetical protein BDF19DRAFT_424473 [Syncephalis fuscata]|nr:hypothetical protein BDF19DRAFT_424473 [Syncephalis fuscata]
MTRLLASIYLQTIIKTQYRSLQRPLLLQKSLSTLSNLTDDAETTASLSEAPKQAHVHIGTAYEQTAKRVLTQLGDRGIDLRGWWTLEPSSSEQPITHYGNSANNVDSVARVRIVCQCKHLRQKLSPGPIRELAGVALREQSIGILVAAKGFGQQAIREWRSSIAPLVLVDLVTEHHGICTAIRWNDMAARQLKGLVVGDRL